LLSIKYFIIKFWINSEISFSKEIIDFETKIRVTAIIILFIVIK